MKYKSWNWYINEIKTIVPKPMGDVTHDASMFCPRWRREPGVFHWNFNTLHVIQYNFVVSLGFIFLVNRFITNVTPYMTLVRRPLVGVVAAAPCCEWNLLAGGGPRNSPGSPLYSYGPEVGNNSSGDRQLHCHLRTPLTSTPVSAGSQVERRVSV